MGRLVNGAGSARVIAGALGCLVAVSCALGSRSDVHVFNRTEVVLQMGFADPVPPCTERVLGHAAMNDTGRPLAEGAWRPTFALAMEHGSQGQIFIVVTQEKTDILKSAPAVVPPCEGQPKDWAP
jgi:hypothetical protein